MGLDIDDLLVNDLETENNEIAISNIIRGCKNHLLITGWKEDWANDKSPLKIGDLTFYYSDDSFQQTSQYLYTQKDDFFCLEYRFDNIDDDDKIENLINNCLKFFSNYINVALIYKNEGKTVYYYHSFFDKKSKKKIDDLKQKMVQLKKLKNEIKDEYSSKPFFKDIVNQYIRPGIYCVEGECCEDEIINFLFDSHEDIKTHFADIPLKANVFSLYYHPKNAFPLPIILRQTMPETNWWDNSNNLEWLSEGDKGKYDKVLNEVLSDLNDVQLMGYYSSSDEFGCKGPHLALCPQKIKGYCQNIGVDEKLGYLIVLIHELAHAIMDKNHCNKSLNSIFARAMEESLANMITLQWFEKYHKKLLKEVKRFIENQPEIYKFGIKQYKAKVDWTSWRDSYKNMHYQLWDWYSTCFKKNVRNETVLNAYNLVFIFNFNGLIEFFKSCKKNEFTPGSFNSYISYIKSIDDANEHETINWLYYCLRNKTGNDSIDYLDIELKKLHASSKEKSGFKQFAICTLGFYDATIQLQNNDKVFCILVMKNALFPSKDVVEKVKKGELGSKENIKKGNKYASWDYMKHARCTESKKNVQFEDTKTYNLLISHGYEVSDMIFADDNTIANQAIKKAIIESYKDYPFVPEWSLFKDYEVCHVWDKPTDRRYYASIANLVLLPRVLAKLTDHNNSVKELLRYEVFKRFGFKPDEEGDPSKPTCYSEKEWRDYGLVKK